MKALPHYFDPLIRAIGHSGLPGSTSLVHRTGVLSANRDHEFQIEWNGIQYWGNFQNFIDRHIFYFGHYAKSELQFLKLATILLRRSGAWCFADIGANVGQHSLFMAQFADRILAFEPNHAVADRFEQNIRLNNLSNIALHRIALGDFDGQASLGSGLPGNDGSRSLNWTLDSSLDLQVAIKHAGRYLQSVLPSGGRIDLLKVDVEGSEKQVFSAMRDILERDRPVMLFELVGRQIKGGYGSPQELISSMYPDHALFGLKGKTRPTLVPFTWSAEQVVCLPVELLGEFDSMIG